MGLWIVWFGASFGAQGFNTFLPSLLKSKHVQRNRLYQDTLTYALAGVPGVWIASAAVESSFGRRHTIVVSLMLTVLGMSLFAWADTEWQLVLFSCVFNLFSNALWCTIFTYTSEVYPTEIRSQGVGVAHASHSVAGVLAPLYGG